MCIRDSSKGKLVTKVNRLEFDDILAGLDLGSVVYPKYLTCDYICLLYTSDHDPSGCQRWR